MPRKTHRIDPFVHSNTLVILQRFGFPTVGDVVLCTSSFLDGLVFSNTSLGFGVFSSVHPWLTQLLAWDTILCRKLEIQECLVDQDSDIHPHESILHRSVFVVRRERNDAHSEL